MKMQEEITLRRRSDIVLPEEPWAAHMMRMYENQKSLNDEIWN